MNLRRGLAAVCVATLALLWAYPRTAGADEPPGGLQLATAMEEVLAKAIAASERSVVAIARVRRDGRDREDLTATAFNQLQAISPPPLPGDADFIPNEYATGVVVGADGLILTAHHVLRDDSEYWVTTPTRKTYKVVKIVGADPRSDLAVMAIEASDLVPITFGNASAVKKGQIVVALGNPYAIARDGQACATWGIISNLARKDRPWAGASVLDQDGPVARPLHQLGTLIQTDARLNQGTSGGALLNLKGEMIGLTVALAVGAGYEQSAGFAIPVDDAFLRAVQTLKQGREVEYGFLGVQPLSLAREERLRGRHGVRVEVVEGTPAERSGLVRGDLITHINDVPIFERDDLMLAIGKLPAAADVRLTVEREGAVKMLVVHELSKNWVAGQKIVTTPAPSWRGMRVDYVTAAREFSDWVRQRRIDPAGAVLIIEVEQNSPAWQEGLRPNMMISHVGSKGVANPKAFHEAVAGQEGPVKLRLNLPPSDNPIRTIPPSAG